MAIERRLNSRSPNQRIVMSEINGMIRAANALHYWERRQEIAANNLANADTNGFKAQRAFGRMIGDAIPVADAATDLSAGALTPTGDPFDLAIANDAFLVIETPNGERLSRGGSFALDQEGRLVDHAGNALLGEGGDIVVPPGSFEVDTTGTIRVEGREVARLRMETVPPGTALTHEGGTVFLRDAASQEQPIESRRLRQGHLEQSNVDTIGSLVDLITIQRNFAAVQRVVTTLDEVRDTISNRLARS